MRKRTAWICSIHSLAICGLTIGCIPTPADPIGSPGAPSSQNEGKSLTSTAKPGASHADFYTVATYDKSLDPAEDFAKTIAQAKAENKRIILQVGGDWCIWCTRITEYMSTNNAVHSNLDKNYLVMKVTYPSEHAADFLAGYPKCEGYPHLFVLEKNGDFLHSQGSGELEEGNGYNEEVFLAFLNKWAP